MGESTRNVGESIWIRQIIIVVDGQECWRIMQPRQDGLGLNPDNYELKNVPNIIVDRVIKSLIFVIKLINIPKKPININPKINSKILNSLTR